MTSFLDFIPMIPSDEGTGSLKPHVLWVGPCWRPEVEATSEVSCGFTSTHVATGAQAIDALIRQRPDLMLIALDLPDMPAIALMRQLRRMQSDALEHPSIILGVRRFGDAADAATDAGFDETIDRARSMERVVHWLDSVGAADDLLEGEIRIDAVVAQTMPGYVQSRRALAAQVEDMLRRGHRAGAARAAHTLAGSPGILGFAKGAAFYRHVEELAENDGMSIDAEMIAMAQSLAAAFAAMPDQ